MWHDSGQGAGGGQAAGKGRQHCAPSIAELLPKPLPRRGEERLCRHPLPLLQTLPCPLFVCLSLCSCCRITSHIFQPAEQGWELLSIARLSSSSSETGKDTKAPPPSPGCQPAWENSPFWGNARNNPCRGVTAGAQPREQGQEEIPAHPVHPEWEEESRALHKCGLQREMGEVCLNKSVFLWQPRKDET